MKSKSSFPISSFSSSEKIDIAGECFFCGNSLDEKEIKHVVNNKKDSLFYFKCSSCQVGYLMGIVRKKGIHKVIITPVDLEYAESFEFKESLPINSDQVIELHNILSKQKITYFKP